MGKKKMINDKEQKLQQMAFWLFPDEKELLMETAKKLRISMSQILRTLIRGLQEEEDYR